MKKTLLIFNTTSFPIYVLVFCIIILIGGNTMDSEAKTGNMIKEDPILSKVIEKKLPNGLIVLFYPYNRQDVINIRLCVRVGSASEDEKNAGITHLIEHMIFKGTETKKSEDIAGVIEALGGYMNAFTTYDYTCYYASGPSIILEKALDILSDVVFHPYFDPQELEREKEVVVEEIKMRFDNPHIVLLEEVMKASYQKHPYRRPIIGYEHTVKSFKREDLLRFVNYFYTPENMILTVVGNVSSDELFNLVEKHFTNLPRRKLKRVKFPEEPYVSHPKIVWVERPVKEGYFVLTFPGTSSKTEDAPLVDLLTEILGGGESSRLYLRLKRELNLVKSISAYPFTPIGPGLIEIYGTADPEKFEDVIKHIIIELEKIKIFGVSEEELKRAKVKILSDFTYDLETSEGISGTLSSFQLKRGNFKDILWYKRKVEEATIKDIVEVAKKYLNPKKMVAGFLSEKKLFDEDLLLSIIKDLSIKEEVEIFSLENGLKVILYPKRDIPTVGLTLTFPGGLRFETPETNGLFQALTLLWTRGTKNFTAEEISRKLEDLGASIKGFTGRNTFGLNAISLTSNLEEVLFLFKDILLNPTFDDKECEKARPELISLILMQEDNPVSLAVANFMKVLFPDHPYGLNPAGTREFYLRFRSKDLKDAYNKFVTPERGVLTVVGNFDPLSLKEKLISLLKDWKSSFSSQISEEEKPREPQQRYQKLSKETFQNQILLGFQTPGLSSKEKIILEVLNNALSGQNGKLFRILRDERSLAYAVTSFTIFYPKKSAFILYIACSPEKENEAISGFWEILEEITEKGFTEEEIKRAKNRTLGKLKLNLQSNLNKAQDMGVNEVLNLGWDYSLKYEEMLRSITQEDIKVFIKNYLTKENAILFILGR